MQLQVNRDGSLNGNDILPPKKNIIKKKKSDKISEVEIFCYDAFPGKLSDFFVLFGFALK